MEYYLEFFKNFIENYPYLTYFLLFAISLAENLFPPIPGDTLVVLIAFLVGKGAMSFYIGWIFTSVGGSIGFMFYYYLGYALGKDFFLKKGWVEKERLDTLTNLFKNFGYFIILINRFLSGIRSIIAISSGIFYLNPTKVFIMSTISISVWNYILIYIGYTAGENWENLLSIFYRYNNYFLLLIILFIFIFIILYLLRSKKQE